MCVKALWSLLYLVSMRRRGREVVHTEIQLCSTSEADPEMEIRMQVMPYETLLGERDEGVGKQDGKAARQQ